MGINLAHNNDAYFYEQLLLDLRISTQGRLIAYERLKLERTSADRSSMPMLLTRGSHILTIRNIKR